MTRVPATSRDCGHPNREELDNYTDSRPLRLMHLKCYPNPQRQQKRALLGATEMKRAVAGGAIALALAVLCTPVLAEDLDFVLTNNSSFAVKSFFTSPADVDTWEEDVFGENYLPAGNYVTVTIGDGREQCTYDMKFIMEDDSEFIEKGVDLCELGEYTLSDAQ
jgi:hypothetical protein